MNTKKIFKLLLDMTMLVLYILLMFGYDISPFFHESVGIGIGVLFIIHILLNAKETRGLARATAKSASLKPKLFFYTDCILVLSMLVTIISGIAISQVIFSFNAIPFVESVHNASAYAALVILACHSALHLKYVAGVIRNSARLRPSGLAKALRRYSAVAAIAVTAYVFALSSFNATTTDPSNNNGSSKKEDTVSSDQDDTDTASQVTETASADDDTPTLDEYLSNLYCTGCGRHCSLLSPQCGKGSAQAAAAQVDYSEQYSS